MCVYVCVCVAMNVLENAEMAIDKANVRFRAVRSGL